MQPHLKHFNLFGTLRPLLVQHVFENLTAGLKCLSIHLKAVHLVLQNSLGGIMLFLLSLEQFLKLTDACSPALSKGTLGSPVLGLSLGWRSVGGGLPAWLRPWRNDPFLAGHGDGCFCGRWPRHGRDDGCHGHLVDGG